VALAMPAGGRILACDVSDAWTRVARKYWAEAGVAEKIDLRLAPALQTLDDLIAAGAGSSFDFAFIDADKTSYKAYYERALTLIRVGGLVAIDNTLWEGRVADPTARDADTQAIRDFNRHLRDDRRVQQCLVPIGDGLSLALKL
jgi:caffeoyl-CoA O-methyltransferase